MQNTIRLSAHLDNRPTSSTTTNAMQSGMSGLTMEPWQQYTTGKMGRTISEKMEPPPETSPIGLSEDQAQVQSSWSSKLYRLTVNMLTWGHHQPRTPLNQAKRELANAELSLLEAQTSYDYITSVIMYREAQIKRLRKFIDTELKRQ